jgi:D-tyrosyl-tRNA(Tyr) deacylase
LKLVIQRVTEAKVEVDNETVGKINEGLMVLVGFGVDDSQQEADFLANKLLKLRIFEDENSRMNRSVQDINGEILLVPQFTLYASTKKHRPSFHKALNPDEATVLFDYFVSKCSEQIHVETGIFGAFMNVSIQNNGPVTIIIEKSFQ